jgi:hypothetical protein
MNILEKTHNLKDNLENQGNMDWFNVWTREY